MRKLLHLFLLFFVSIFVSCNSSNEDENNQNGGTLTLEKVLANCVDNIIIPLNAKTALYADSAFNSIDALQYGQYGQSQIDKAANLFLNMRLAYEQSEGFFLGANANYTIDSDINNWPLDHHTFDQLMASNRRLNDPENESSSIVGFHALEYIFFRNGQIRNFSVITEKELTYAKALIKHLRIKLFQVECGWDGDKNKEHVALLKLNGAPYLAPDGTSYRKYMLTKFTTRQLAAALISGDHGLVGQADEVAFTKLLRPFSVDSSYIESPYSQTSLLDLEYNLRSIRSIWYATTDGTPQKGNASFDTYLKKNNPTLATKIEQQLQKCDDALRNIPTPFVIHCHDSRVKAASDEFITLSTVLGEAGDYFQSH